MAERSQRTRLVPQFDDDEGWRFSGKARQLGLWAGAGWPLLPWRLRPPLPSLVPDGSPKQVRPLPTGYLRGRRGDSCPLEPISRRGECPTRSDRWQRTVTACRRE
jgi:hypothetical protein